MNESEIRELMRELNDQKVTLEDTGQRCWDQAAALSRRIAGLAILAEGTTVESMTEQLAADERELDLAEEAYRRTTEHLRDLEKQREELCSHIGDAMGDRTRATIAIGKARQQAAKTRDQLALLIYARGEEKP